MIRPATRQTGSPTTGAAQPRREQPGQRCQDRPVGPVRTGPGHLTAQHYHLVAQHQDLRVPRCLAAAQQDQPAEHPDHDQIQQTDRHEPRSCLNLPTKPNRSPASLRRVLTRYTPAVLDEDGHEGVHVPLVPGVIVNGELSYRVDRHRSTVPTARAASSCTAGDIGWRAVQLSTRPAVRGGPGGKQATPRCTARTDVRREARGAGRPDVGIRTGDTHEQPQAAGPLRSSILAVGPLPIGSRSLAAHDRKTSHFPPATTAVSVPASHSRAQIWRGM